MPDASLAVYVDGKSRSDDIVLLIANAAFPDTVAEDVAHARHIKTQVSPHVGRHIVTPVYEGRFEGQSFAAFSRLSPLSDHRVIRRFQKSKAANGILPWIIALARETRKTYETPADYQRSFIHPLERLAGDPDLPSPVRDRATQYLAHLDQGDLPLFTTAQHGDFWCGNVLFDRRRFAALNPRLGGFSVIDWRTACVDGYPCFDWMRFCVSLFRIGSLQNDRLMSRYREALQISSFDCHLYCLMALGRLGDDLDHFPKDKFGSLCDTTLQFLDAHVR